MYIYIYTYTWNPTDLYFWRSTPQSKAFSDENKGHLGSRYVSTLFTYLCVFFEFLFWLFSGDGCSATNFVLDNSTWIIHTPNSPKTIFSIHLRTWRCPAAKGKSSTIRIWVPMLAFRSFVDPHARKKGLPRPLLWPHERCGHSPQRSWVVPIPFQWGRGSPDLKALVKLGDVVVKPCLAVCLPGSFFCRGFFVVPLWDACGVYIQGGFIGLLPQCTFDFQEYLDECRTAKLFVALMAEDPFKYYTDSESCRICKLTITQMHSTFLLSFVSLQESSVCTTGQTCWWSQMMGSKLRLFPFFIGQKEVYKNPI